MYPDLTRAGLESLADAVELIEKGTKRVDLEHDTIVYRVPSNNPKKYTIRIDMKVSEEEE